jgi:hypothetical protein
MRIPAEETSRRPSLKWNCSDRGVLDAAVGMEEDFGGAAAMEERHGQSL